MQNVKIINRSNLIEMLSTKYTDLPYHIITMTTKHIFEIITNALSENKKIELRNFGNFSLRFHPARLVRNPKTGQTIKMCSKYTVHFKPGKKLNAKVNKQA